MEPTGPHCAFTDSTINERQRQLRAADAVDLDAEQAALEAAEDERIIAELQASERYSELDVRSVYNAMNVRCAATSEIATPELLIECLDNVSAAAGGLQ